MKRLSRVVFLLISVLVFMGSAPARGEWPNIGHTEYKGTERGGMDTTTGYYRDIWAGARAQKQKKEPSLPSSPPIANNGLVDKIPVTGEPKPDLSALPVSRPDFSAPPAKMEGVLLPCAGGRCGSWIQQQGGKFVWTPNAR